MFRRFKAGKESADGAAMSVCCPLPLDAFCDYFVGVVTVYLEEKNNHRGRKDEHSMFA